MLLKYISIYSALIPLAAGIKRPGILWFYILLCLIADLAIVSAKATGDPELHKWIGNPFVILEFIMISFIYRKRIFKNDSIFVGVVAAILLLFLLTIKSFKELNTFGYSLLLLLYAGYGILGLYAILKAPQIIALERSSFFWINVALIIYASGDFLLLLFKDYLWEADKAFFLKLWGISFLVLNITKNLLLSFATYHYKPELYEPD